MELRSDTSASETRTVRYVPFVVEERCVEEATEALRKMQELMKGEAERVGLYTDEDVAEWITQSRREEAGLL